MTIFDEDEEEEQIDARSSIQTETEESTIDDFFSCESDSTILAQSLGDQSTLKAKDSSSSSSSTVPDETKVNPECDSLDGSDNFNENPGKDYSLDISTLFHFKIKCSNPKQWKKISFQLILAKYPCHLMLFDCFS